MSRLASVASTRVPVAGRIGGLGLGCPARGNPEKVVADRERRSKLGKVVVSKAGRRGKVVRLVLVRDRPGKVV